MPNARWDAVVSTVKAAADAAMARADNARQMVLTRDPTLTALQETAATASAAVRTGAEDRAALHVEVAALSQQLAALQSSINALPIIRTGSAAVSAALLPGATRDVVVPLGAKMPNAVYTPGVWITGGTGLLGSTRVVGVVAQTDAAVTVQIKNEGLAAIAAAAMTVQVLAIR